MCSGQPQPRAHTVGVGASIPGGWLLEYWHHSCLCTRPAVHPPAGQDRALGQWRRSGRLSMGRLRNRPASDKLGVPDALR
jgi:hypothetical protein